MYGNSIVLILRKQRHKTVAREGAKWYMLGSEMMGEFVQKMDLVEKCDF